MVATHRLLAEVLAIGILGGDARDSLSAAMEHYAVPQPATRAPSSTTRLPMVREVCERESCASRAGRIVLIHPKAEISVNSPSKTPVLRRSCSRVWPTATTRSTPRRGCWEDSWLARRRLQATARSSHPLARAQQLRTAHPVHPRPLTPRM